MKPFISAARGLWSCLTHLWHPDLSFLSLTKSFPSWGAVRNHWIHMWPSSMIYWLFSWTLVLDLIGWHVKVSVWNNLLHYIDYQLGHIHMMWSSALCGFFEIHLPIIKTHLRDIFPAATMSYYLQRLKNESCLRYQAIYVRFHNCRCIWCPKWFFSGFFSNGYIFDYFNNLLLVVMDYKMLQALTIYYFL